MTPHKYASLKYILDHAKNVLLVAHSRPDPDTIGANIALYNYLQQRGTSVTLTCTDSFPAIFNTFLPPYTLIATKDLTIKSFDVIIGSDNIDRGFDHITNNIKESDCVTVGIDHHPHTHIHPDLLITDPSASSTCEILYDFFTHIQHTPTSTEASALAIGILGDTRLFHNPNTSAHVLDVTAHLLDAQAPLASIMRHGFLTKRLGTLQLWGIALRNAKRLTPSGAIISVITMQHLTRKNLPQEELKEELKEVASLLCSVPHTPFALILIQLDKNTVKGSIRAEKNSTVDTSRIAALFGGGGHKLASGFEVAGTLKVINNTWQVA